MPDVLLFLGRFHVLALHVPIGLACAAVAADWLSRSSRWRTLAQAAPFLWGATAVSALVTVALGYLHFAEGGFTGPSASAHRLYGTILAAVCVAGWCISAMRPALHRRLNVVSGLLVLGLVTITGHFGGNLTHGSDFLVAYAPAPVRALLGLGERRPPVTDLAAADPWHDVVGPMLDARCSGCHNDDKRSGGYSVVDYAKTLAGGETGTAVVPGNVEFSELVRRVSLPDDDEAFMPAEGKTPLTADQLAILRWWVGSGAPVDVTLADLDVPPDVGRLLSAAVGLTAAGASAASPGVVAADAAIVDALFDAGFLVRQVSQADPRLAVSVNSVGTPVDGEQLAVLLTAAGSIVSLDLHDTQLGDSALEDFAAFEHLEHLRLSRNGLTDAGVASIAGLPALKALNLYGNPGVTDASLDSIRAMPGIETVYLWGTGVTREGIAALAAVRPDLQLNAGAAAFPPAP